MGDPFRAETWTATITDPDDGEEFEVTLRTPLAIDNARLNDVARSNGGTEVTLGTMRLQQVVDSIVEWSMPHEVSRDAIENMREELYVQIRSEVEAGPPTKRQPSDAETELAVAMLRVSEVKTPATLEQLEQAAATLRESLPAAGERAAPNGELAAMSS